MNRHFREYYRLAFSGIELLAITVLAPFLLPFACIGWVREKWKTWRRIVRSTDYPPGLFGQ